VLSQWYPAEFADESGRAFSSAEHYMMWRKAILFDDPATAEVLAPPSPREAKALGRRVSSFREGEWVQHRWSIVVEGARLKFGSDPELRSYLLGTRDRVLVEASPRDRVPHGSAVAANPPTLERRHVRFVVVSLRRYLLPPARSSQPPPPSWLSRSLLGSSFCPASPKETRGATHTGEPSGARSFDNGCFGLWSLSVG
jgi:ribA/ribD-fused uncharacterized protein